MGWVSALGLVVGVVLGLFFRVPIPPVYAKYLGLAILASFDTMLGGLRAHFEHNFDRTIFLTGFFFNSIAAALLSYLGDQIGVEMYLAVIFVFGTRIFSNLGALRRHFIQRLKVKAK